MPNKLPTLEELFKNGVHYGHLKKFSHPRSRSYIYTTLNKTYVIDLEKTIKQLEKAIDYINNCAQDGKQILWVGTKNNCHELAKNLAEKLNHFYITNKWSAGILTNFDIIKLNLAKLNEMLEQSEAEYFEKLTKIEKNKFNDKLKSLKDRFFGVRKMTKMPDVMIVLDPDKEKNAIREAKLLDIPMIGIGDTKTNPDLFDVFVPINDDGKKSLEIIFKTLEENLGI